MMVGSSRRERRSKQIDDSAWRNSENRDRHPETKWASLQQHPGHCPGKLGEELWCWTGQEQATEK